jgi:hypothetical protein
VLDVITSEQIENANVSPDAKTILKIVAPMLSNMRTMSLVLEDIVKSDTFHYKTTDSIKEILVGTQANLDLGKGPDGIKGDLKKIIDATSISKNLQNKDLISIEDVIDYNIQFTQKEIKEIKDILTTKPHWTKNVQGIKDIIMMISLGITMLLTIYGAFIK